jgi:hypothetical protein
VQFKFVENVLDLFRVEIKVPAQIDTFAMQQRDFRINDILGVF